MTALKGLVVAVVVALAAMVTIPVSLAVMDDQTTRDKVLANVGLKTPQAETLDTKAIALRIHELVNNERVKVGVKPLAYDERLAAIAQAHSEDMISRQYVDHVNPEGKSPTDRYKDGGVACASGGAENIYAYGVLTEDFAQRAVDSWMSSPEHRENILHRLLLKEGIGIAHSENFGIIATQNFC